MAPWRQPNVLMLVLLPQTQAANINLLRRLNMGIKKNTLIGNVQRKTFKTKRESRCKEQDKRPLHLLLPVLKSMKHRHLYSMIPGVYHMFTSYQTVLYFETIYYKKQSFFYLDCKISTQVTLFLRARIK